MDFFEWNSQCIRSNTMLLNFMHDSTSATTTHWQYIFVQIRCVARFVVDVSVARSS